MTNSRNTMQCRGLVPSTEGFSGIAGCTPSIASQCTETKVSKGALGIGASVTYINKMVMRYKEYKKLLEKLQQMSSVISKTLHLSNQDHGH